MHRANNTLELRCKFAIIITVAQMFVYINGLIFMLNPEDTTISSN